MEEKDIRWQQRFKNYKKALGQLSLFVEKGKSLNKLEEQGLIKAFEYTYELAWNTLKDFLEYQSGGRSGYNSINMYGSRDAITEAFKAGLIADGEAWMNMLKDRNRTVHTYNEPVADEIANSI